MISKRAPEINQISSRYENGRSHADLFEVFLTCDDFGISLEEYREQLGIIKSQESQNIPLCSFHTDIDGKSIVSNLILRDKFLRIEITKDRFRRIPIVTPKFDAAFKYRPNSPSDFLNFFSPHPISDPLYFVGRQQQLRKAIQAFNGLGTIIIISGKRSIGKLLLLICFWMHALEILVS